MKAAPILAILAIAVAPAVFAQQGALDNAGRMQLAPAPAPATPAAEPEVTLIPEQVSQNTKPAPAAQPATEKKSKTEAIAEDLADPIHFREARTKALRDAQVQVEWERANKAKTDYGKREGLKSYYKLLYAKIVKIDPSVKKVSEFREKVSLHRLEQTRIDPTAPLDDSFERIDRGE